jgi:iron complex outermembrane recepter protein
MFHPRFLLAPLAVALTLAGFAGTAVAQSAAASHIALPAQPLGNALNELARQAGLQLMVHPDLVAGRQAPAVAGTLTVREALDRLLSGSGLAADIRGSEVIVRRAPQPGAGKPAADTTLAAVAVTARGGSPAASLKRVASAGALGSRSVLDTPFSVSSVGSEEIEERLVTSVEQAFRYDASTQQTGGEYGQSASFSVRGLGLDTSNGFKVDGLPMDAWGNTMPLEPFERIDLLKGLSGFMHGFGAPGGIANYVMKRPTEDTRASLTVGYKSDSLWSEALDAGGRFGEDGRFGYRVNVAHEEGDTYVNRGELRRTVASLALDARLTRDLTATFDVIHADRLSTGNNFWGVSVGALQAIPSTVDPDIATQPEGSYYNTDNRIFTAGLQWRFAPDWRANVSWRTTHRDIDYHYSTLYVSDRAGNYTADASSYRFVTEFDALQAMVEGEVRTGSIGHQLTFGASRQELTTRSDSESTYVGNIGAGNIHTDSTLAISGKAASHRLYKGSSIKQTALFVSDTIRFSERWSLIAGARYTEFDQTNLNRTGAVTARYKRDPVTPTLALLFKPTADSTVYVSAVESLERGGTPRVGLANANIPLGPIKSRQYEIGYKVDRPAWGGTVALFRLDRTAEYERANYLVQDGVTRYEGIDLNARLRVVSDLWLTGGVMLLESTYIENNAGLEDQRTTGTPHLQAALRADWQVAAVRGLSLSLGGKHVGSSMMNTANSYAIAAYTVFDAGVNYALPVAGRDVTFTAAIQNLADREYWVYNGANYLMPGAPRTLSLAARVAF